MSDIEALYIDLTADPDAGDPRRRVWTARARQEAARLARKKGSTHQLGTPSRVDPRRADMRLRKFD